MSREIEVYAGEGCTYCPLFQPHRPMRCQVDNQVPPRPYGERPDWCPLEVGPVSVVLVHEAEVSE